MDNWQTVDSLNNISLDGVQGVVADIDYTLVDFAPAHEAGIQALAFKFNKELSLAVDGFFHLILEGHRKPQYEAWAKRVEFDQLMEQMKSVETVDKEHHLKVWSREAWIMLVGQGQGLKFTAESLSLARDVYWQALSKRSALYADAKDFVKTLLRQKIPLVLMTGSDSILKLQEATGKLIYDPAFSENYKRQRLLHLPIQHAGLVIGDPIDKPHPEFFNKTENTLHELRIDPHQTIFIGDSPRNDLGIPSERGYKAYYINRKHPSPTS